MPDGDYATVSLCALVRKHYLNLSIHTANFSSIHMKNSFTVLTATALSAATLLLNSVCAQSPLDLFKKAAEAAAKPEQQRPPEVAPSPASSASIPASTASLNPVARSNPAPTSPSSPIAPASGGSEMQHSEVEMLLTRSRASSWADAQKKAVTKVNDGDPLWIFLKTAKPLKEYVYSNQDDPNSVGQLSLVIAPSGKFTSMSQGRKNYPEDNWPLRPEEMRSNEIAISLSPGGARAIQSPGANNIKSGRADFFLRVAGGRIEHGVWGYDIFVIGNKQHIDAFGRPDSGGILRQVPLAVVPITVDVSNGTRKYEALRSEDCSPFPTFNKPCKGKQ
jgi:hypothetical protein